MNKFTRPTLSFGFPTTATPHYPTYGPPSVSSSRTKYPTYGPPSVSTSSPRMTLSGFLNKAVGYRTHDEYALDAVNNALSYPQVNTPTIDAGSSVMDALRGTAAAILQNMGSTGDGDVIRVSNPRGRIADGGGQTASLLDSPVVLIGLVLGAGALIYAVNK